MFPSLYDLLNLVNLAILFDCETTFILVNEIMGKSGFFLAKLSSGFIGLLRKDAQNRVKQYKEVLANGNSNNEQHQRHQDEQGA